MEKKEKNNWVAPQIEDLSAKETESGASPAASEATTSVQYTVN